MSLTRGSRLSPYEILAPIGAGGMGEVNVKVRDDGTVEVLDFGLAKAFDPAASSGADAMHSPTSRRGPRRWD